MVSIKRGEVFFNHWKQGHFPGVSSLFKKWAFDFVSRKYVKKKKSQEKKENNKKSALTSALVWQVIEMGAIYLIINLIIWPEWNK